MLTSRKALYVALFGLLAVTLVVMWATRTQSPRTRPAEPQEWSPKETLDAFIEAQESGEVTAVREFLASAARAEFDEMSSVMERDDLIATGLHFRQEQYRLEETTATTATFYSPASALYLVMVREENRWRIDPKRTDRLNKEGTTEAAGSETQNP